MGEGDARIGLYLKKKIIQAGKSAMGFISESDQHFKHNSSKCNFFLG